MATLEKNKCEKEVEDRVKQEIIDSISSK